jgi:hypothetical protein
MPFLDQIAVRCESLLSIAWQFLQTPEGAQTIASVGGILIILYYLQKEAVPGGKIVAVIITAVLVVGLWVILLADLLNGGLLTQ